ncbi:MAG: hypothetical protein ABIN74_10910, partial [Ferruginibacter sp.]
MKKICILFICLCCLQNGYSQLSMQEELQTRLSGKTKFYDIKSTVDNFYKEKKAALLRPADSTLIKQINRERKKWNRYFYECETHLNSAGEIENAAQRTFDYINSHDLQNSSFTQSSIGGSWSLLGPTNTSGGIGRINRMAYHPSNSQILYAGSSGGGLFKTTNGVSWSNIASFIPSLGISGIVVSHNDPNTIYVLTGDGDGYNGSGFTYDYGYVRYSVGILKSTDGGQSFQQTGDLPGATGNRYVGFNLVQDPNNANVLMAATNRGAYRTTDGGATWIQCSFTGISNQRRVYDIEYKPGSSTTVYCTARDDNGDCRFYKSSTSGTTFLGVSISSMDDATRIEIAVTPANSSYVYLLAGPGYMERDNNSNNTFKGLFRSTNSGDNFTRRSNSPDILGYDDILNTFPHQSAYDLSLAASPTNANTIIAGGLVAWRSTDGGTSWSEIVDYFEDTDNSNYIHADIHHLIYNPANNALYASTDGGVSISNDNGNNWANLFSGLSCTQFYHFEAGNEDEETWGGAQDNGTQIRNGVSSTFTKFDGGDGYDVLTDKAPAGNNDDSYWVVNKEIWADGIVDVNVTPDIDEFFPNLAMCPTNEDILFAGYSKLFFSYNRGSDWDYYYDNYPIPGNWSLSTCPTNVQRIYAAGINDYTEGLFRIDNLFTTANATNLSFSLEDAGYPSSHPKITDIAVSPNGSNIIWVTVSGYTDGQKVYYSSNAGTSWQNISNGLPNLPVHTIVADANNNVYIGTDIGVYYRGNGQSQWTPFYNGLPRVAISELEIAFDLVQMELRLFASTYGRGIWISDIYGSCPSSLSLSTTLQGQRFYQASSSINSTSPVTGGYGTNVNFRSGVE